MPGTKVATCCYCGTRAALVLKGEGRHELSCSSCGAPLHDLKMLRSDHPTGGAVVKPSPVRGKVPGAGKLPRRKAGKRKGFGRRFLAEAWDAIEDIFD